MKSEDVVSKALDSIEKNDLQSSRSLYSEDFTFTGPVPMAMNKEQYLDLMGKMLQGISDWNFHRHDVRVEGQTVVVPANLTGKQTGTLRSLMPGMPDIPPTNRTFHNPPETMRITVRGDQIVNIHVDPVQGGGVLGILEQLGVQVPVTGKPGSMPGSMPGDTPKK